MKHESAHNILVGTYGWEQAHWSGSFYPHDLPAGWRLGYYSNEFDCVLVPAAYWDDACGYDCYEWADEVNDNFRFYLELPPGLNDDPESQGLFLKDVECLQDHLGGIVAAADQAWLHDAAAGFAQLPRDRQLSSGFIQASVDGANGLLCLHHDLVDKRAARRLLEQSIQACDGYGVHVDACIFGAERLLADDLVQMRQIVEIMGL